MREIKFRAWDENRKKWVYFRLDEIVNINHESLTDDEWAFIQLKNIGQYTGLKDKNGREIYEKDIVKFKLLTRDGEKRGIGIVEWNDIERAWVVKVVKSDSGMPIMKYYLLGFIKDEQLRVIGNIYENPELLEEADEE